MLLKWEVTTLNRFVAIRAGPRNGGLVGTDMKLGVS